jgi:hypothetical protein
VGDIYDIGVQKQILIILRLLAKLFAARQAVVVFKFEFRDHTFDASSGNRLMVSITFVSALAFRRMPECQSSAVSMS